MATYQSLYRRYRPQRFDEVLGQDHVTRALRNAVREGRVGHAYLFSGPRGTGKTSTARILAKVLNCAAPADGEPCGVCESCRVVAEGRVTDWLLEQDAASKSKVDDMRDLLERVPLGTSGNRKVIILDEVHMLSQGAENALLKTLEEPPEHVVFVLATTDPQKVRPTIRSRTQHFEFRLLPPDVLADHVRAVISDAELGLAPDAVDHVVRAGGGSARDTLSALDQVAALGEVVDRAEPVDAVVDALCDRDAGAVLVAVADALASGRDPRSLGEAVIVSLRNAFLALMGAADTHLPSGDRPRAALVGERLGAPGVTRALEVLGEALVELARKPDPRIVVEVALVRLTRPDTDRTLDAVLERLDRLERGLPSGPGSGAVVPPAGGPVPAGADAGRDGPGPTPSGGGEAAGPAGGATRAAPRRGGGRGGGRGGSPPESRSGGGAASGGASVASARAVLAGVRAPSEPPPAGVDPVPAPAPPTLGAVARGRAERESAQESPGPVVDDSPPSPAPSGKPQAGVARGRAERSAPSEPPGQSVDVPASPAPASGPELGEIVAAWDGKVLGQLAIKVRSKWRGGRWLDTDATSARFAVDNEWHQRACEETRSDVERALSDHFGRRVPVAVIVGGAEGPGAAAAGASPDRSASAAAPPPDDDADEHIDPSELRDAGDAATGGVDLLMREFGGELVEGER